MQNIRRNIPQGTTIDIETTCGSRGEISAEDMELTLKLVSEMRDSGAIHESSYIKGATSEEFEEIFNDAINSAVAERERSPELYDEKLDNELNEMGEVKPTNFLMQKFEDYEGMDYNPGFRVRASIEEFRAGRKPGRKQNKNKRKIS